MDELMILNYFKSDCSAKDLALIRAQDLPRAKFMKGTGIKNKSKETEGNLRTIYAIIDQEHFSL